MTATDILLSFPGLLLAIALVAFFGAGVVQVIAAIVIADLPRAVRLQRSLALDYKSRSFIDAARMVSAPTWWILIRHVIPNAVAPMLVVASIYAANAIVVEASLSFLGLGIIPPQPSWGNLIREGQRYLLEGPWISTYPGIVLLIVAIGLHLISDGIRARLDPRPQDPLMQTNQDPSASGSGPHHKLRVSSWRGRGRQRGFVLRCSRRATRHRGRKWLGQEHAGALVAQLLPRAGRISAGRVSTQRP